MKRFTVFYAGLVYGEFEDAKSQWLYALPDGVYLYCREASGRQGDPKWLLKDLTPVLLEDVPKELRMNVLLMQ